MPGSSASVSIRQQQQIPKEKKEYVSHSDREGGKKKEIFKFAARLQTSENQSSRRTESREASSSIRSLFGLLVSNRATGETLGFTVFKRGSADVSLSN